MGKALPKHSVDQWHPTKNTSPMEKATAGSKKNAWWLCSDCGHEWESRIQVHASGSGCPACRTRSLTTSVADDPVSSWWSKANEVEASAVKISETGVRRWWTCPRGHEWSMTVNGQRRRNKSGDDCPVCSGRRSTEGSYLLTDHDAFALWDTVRNEDNPESLTIGSNKTVWWLCAAGHSWQETVMNRCRRKDALACEQCSSAVSVWKKAVARRPELADLFSKANTVSQDSITSTKTILSWECTEGHSWDAALSAMVRTRNGCPYCSGLLVAPGQSLAEKFPILASQWSSSNDKKASEVSVASSYKAAWECDHGHAWTVPVYSRTRNGDMASCPFCAGSAPENAVYGFLREHLGADAIQTRNRSLVAPYELDLVVPHRKVAIEFHGLYWHGETAGKDRNYHYTKWDLARKAGYQLLTIWEDDWRDRREVVEKMLLHKLGISNQEVVYGRKTSIVDLAHRQAHEFENVNHIQGASRSGRHIGLMDKETLVAVCSYTVSGNTMTIDRYCTSHIVVGGFTKLLKHAERTNPAVSRIITFADHEVSDGTLYAKHGFTAEKVLDPDYKYVYRGERVHKFNFRRTRFDTDPALTYDPELSESQLAALNSIDRVWDCGKTRYVKTV